MILQDSRYPLSTLKSYILKYQIRKSLLIIFLAPLLLLQSCIEIVEEVTINKDQSGRMGLSVNAGGNNNPFMALINQFADMSFMDEVTVNAKQVKEILERQDGISNVRYTESRRKGQLELSFDFENEGSLNNALYAAGGYEKTFFQPKLYKIKKNKFVRKNTTAWMIKLIEQEKENIPDEAIFDLIEIKSVYHFPEKARCINAPKDVVSSDNDRTFTSSNYLSDLIDKKTNTRIKIKY